jgi:hypothetical protein
MIRVYGSLLTGRLIAIRLQPSLLAAWHPGRATDRAAHGTDFTGVFRSRDAEPMAEYERWRTPLGRYIALADAACSFNPRFGQGMSAATVSARLQQQCLVRYGVADSRLPRAFFAAQAHFQQTPWLFAAADDLRLPMSEGHRSLSMRLFNWYRPQLVTCLDPEVSARLGEVTLFLQPMSSLFAPQIVSRVLVASTGRSIRAIGQKPASPCVASIPPDAKSSA